MRSGAAIIERFGSGTSDQEAFYALEAAAYSAWHERFRAARSGLGMKAEDPGPLPDSRARRDLKNNYGPLIEDTTARLEGAPDDPAAANQLSLVLLDRADLSDTPDEYRQYITKANEWGRKGLGGAPKRIRVGGSVQAASLIRKVTPLYPQAAKAAGVQGTVRFTMLLGKDGMVRDLQLVSGHPLLVPNAYNAVCQWVYRPTTLNGNPVEILTIVDINFTLTP